MTYKVYAITKYVLARTVAEAIRTERTGTISDVCIADSQRNDLVASFQKKPTKRSPMKAMGIRPNGRKNAT